MAVECDNGHAHADTDITIGLKDIPDLGERLDPGSVVPAGECPTCGSLTYVIEGER